MKHRIARAMLDHVRRQGALVARSRVIWVGDPNWGQLTSATRPIPDGLTGRRNWADKPSFTAPDGQRREVSVSNKCQINRCTPGIGE